MAEEKQLSMAEVRKTIASSLGAAFGFVIALVWSNVVLGGLALTGAPLTAPKDVTSLAVCADRMAQAREVEVKFRRDLGLLDITMIGLGPTIGTTIFLLVGPG